MLGDIKKNIGKENIKSKFLRFVANAKINKKGKRER